MNYVYMIKDIRNNLYIGITENPTQRLVYHNSHRGAQFTKTSYDFSIVFLEEYLTLSDARTREIQLKNGHETKKRSLLRCIVKELILESEKHLTPSSSYASTKKHLP